MSFLNISQQLTVCNFVTFLLFYFSYFSINRNRFIWICAVMAVHMRVGQFGYLFGNLRHIFPLFQNIFKKRRRKKCKVFSEFIGRSYLGKQTLFYILLGCFFIHIIKVCLNTAPIMGIPSDITAQFISGV